MYETTEPGMRKLQIYQSKKQSMKIGKKQFQKYEENNHISRCRQCINKY